MEASTKIELQDSLLFFNTGMERNAGEILKEQENQDNKDYILSGLVILAEKAIKHLYNHELEKFGYLLNTAWNLKSSLKGTTNEKINNMYQTAINAGALGGKILGAGGGGFLMMFVPPSAKINVCKLMKYQGYERRDFTFSNKGADFDIKRRWMSY